VLALLVAGAMIAAGCGGSSDNGGSSGASATTSPATASPGTSAPAATSGGSSSSAEAAKIAGFAFEPDSIKVSAGQKITWTNDDSTAHTVTADDGSFDSGSLADGKSFTFTFAKAGTFKYHCSFHSNILGSVDVA
jgi:plastocyanin